MSRRKDIAATIVSAVLGLTLAAGIWFGFKGWPMRHSSGLLAPTVRSIMELESCSDTSAALITGYNYHLLRKFAKEKGVNLTIELAAKGRSYLDSLRRGSADIVVLPFEEAMAIDSALVSVPVDSLTVWVVRHDWGRELRELNEWIASAGMEEDYESVRNSFMKVYSPFRSRPRKYLSPYDSLVKHAADSIGWDWRLLSAVIFQESQFHIEAESYRGAKGLLQMMPSAARSFGVEDLLDPEQSIRAGARYLNLLSGRYAGIAANSLEKQKFALAAYNAGAGRIKDCIEFSRYLGIEPHCWDDIVQVIPRMRDSTILDVDAVKLGVFQGYETLAYVDQVMAVYNEFCRIHPNR